MAEIVQGSTEQHRRDALSLFHEYLLWGAESLKREFGIDWDVEDTLRNDEASIGKFMPPDGVLYLAYVDGEAVGVACLRLHSDGGAELKRTYVRPDYRKRGLGRALLDAVLESARAAGRPVVRLDSPSFFVEAHSLYRRAGFQETTSYPETDIPKAMQHHWLFMELPLERTSPRKEMRP